ncbi:MAG: histone deacetylase, partial [Anaerolineae bacterium]|nr:histone deacetylase [Anaerolineae bacterium]
VIIDCDVHQGDGTAAILADTPSVYTFSIHAEKNYPFRKQKSDLDIGLEDGTTDSVYLTHLTRGLDQAIEESGAELAIYLAGADPYEHDTLGRLALTKNGLRQRDELVLETCRAAGIPVAISMAGGYAKKVEDIVDIHFQTVKTAAQLYNNGWD